MAEKPSHSKDFANEPGQQNVERPGLCCALPLSPLLPWPTPPRPPRRARRLSVARSLLILYEVELTPASSGVRTTLYPRDTIAGNGSRNLAALETRRSITNSSLAFCFILLDTYFLINLALGFHFFTLHVLIYERYGWKR